jgi:hypothetical protein
MRVTRVLEGLGPSNNRRKAGHSLLICTTPLRLSLVLPLTSLFL